jgi:hypothetical protein
MPGALLWRRTTLFVVRSVSSDVILSCSVKRRRSLVETMTTKDTRDHGILNAFGILRSPPRAGQSSTSAAHPSLQGRIDRLGPVKVLLYTLAKPL